MRPPCRYCLTGYVSREPQLAGPPEWVCVNCGRSVERVLRPLSLQRPGRGRTPRHKRYRASA